jgi:hypothetical protein
VQLQYHDATVTNLCVNIFDEFTTGFHLRSNGTDGNDDYEHGGSYGDGEVQVLGG